MLRSPLGHLHQEPVIMDDYTSLPLPENVAIALEALKVPKAISFAQIIVQSSFAELVDCQQVTADEDPFFRQGDEIVVFDITPQVGQQPINDIRFVERIAVHFDALDHNIPWVYALRADFPKVVHRNALYFEQPQCLCIYENTYDELKVDWRSIKFLEDIRHWLELTAKDALHQDDQPLEAFLVANMGTIIVPPDYKAEDTLFIYYITRKGGRLSLAASRIELKKYEPYPAHVILLKGEPQAQGVIGMTPNNLTALHQMLLGAGVDLFDVIKKTIHGLPKTAESMAQRLMIFLELPKLAPRPSVNENDFYVFLTAENADEIGLQMQFLDKDEFNALGNVLFEQTDTTLGKPLGVGALLPQIQLTPDWALLLSGNIKHFDQRETRIFQIGVGALGSQFFMNNARSGFGRWTLTDHDTLLPHNLVRHAGDATYMGNFKSIGLALTANQIFGGDNFADAIVENYLHPERPEELTARLQLASVIVDVSTSIAVARDLADRKDLAGRRISMFLSPSGRDLVTLAEDQHRQLPLDALEFQYYQRLVDDPEMKDHLASEKGVRLSTSCRDISARISQDHVAIHAGIASAAFRKMLSMDVPMIGIWRINEANMSVIPSLIEAENEDVCEIEGWTIRVSVQLIDKIAQARLSKLPNETGGILIGGYDLERKKIYLTDTILSPKDSEEYPTAYIRGTDGVEMMLSEYSSKTADHLKYAGEWHSHPQNCSLAKSSDDIKLFEHIHQEMLAIGFPTLMIIVGDDKKYQIYFQPKH